jgi:hypothetical protein
VTSVPRDPGWKNLTYPEGELTNEQIMRIIERNAELKRRRERDQNHNRA